MTGNCDVIIPSKNAPWWLALCLEELSKNAGADELGQIIVVDDGSNPDSFAVIERICARHANVRLLKNDGRTGFGGACNFGVRHALAPYFLFLNTDCLITRNTIRKLVAACEADPQIGLACPLSNNSPCLTLPMAPGRSYAEMNELLEMTASNLPLDEVILDACTVVGNCLLITRKCWEKTGEFGETWGQGYGEESDYQMRALEHGLRGVALTNTYVYHFGNGTFRYEPGANALRDKNHGLFLAKWGARYKMLRAKQEQQDPVELTARRLAALPEKTLAPHVLFILPGVAQGIGGVHAVVDLCNHLLRQGIDAKCAVLGSFSMDTLKNFQEAVYFGFLHYPDEGSLFKQTGVMPKCMVATLYSTVPACFVFTAINRIPLVYFVQGYECLFSNGAHYNEVADTYRMANHLVVTSEWLKSRVSTHLQDRPLTVLPIGIDLDVFTSKKITAAPRKKIRIGLVLRDADDKGQWILLDLINELSEQQNLVELTVLAAPRYEKPRGWDKHNCRWVPLPLDRARVAAELSSCDVFVDASLHEGFGLLPLEAMACGATVVVSDSGGINQYVRHNVNGVIVSEINRPDKYATAVLALAHDRTLLEKLKANAQKTASEYGAAELYRGYESFFKEVLAAPIEERDPVWCSVAKMFRSRSKSRLRRISELSEAQARRIAELEAERERVVNGLSFRIGRMFTAPIRAILGKP